jgi:hypothetical protein
MEELFQLRSYIERGLYEEALTLIGEMEEMSRDDKINKIESFLDVLLLHLIKKHAEKRTTRSWEGSIRNAVDMIHRTNKRRKAGGYYLNRDELQEAVEESWNTALRRASFEVLEGRYDEFELARMVDAGKIKDEALRLISVGTTP